MDRIVLEGIVAHGRHGAYDHEREHSQPFHVDIELRVDLTRAGISDELHDTVDYGEIYRDVVRVIEERSYALLERLASAALDEILRDPRVFSAQISIAKPGLLDGATPRVIVTRDNRAR